MIQGSIRDNLDPFNEFSDEQIRVVLKEVKLWSHIEANCENGLQTKISENNSVFSIG